MGRFGVGNLPRDMREIAKNEETIIDRKLGMTLLKTQAEYGGDIVSFDSIMSQMLSVDRLSKYAILNGIRGTIYELSLIDSVNYPMELEKSDFGAYIPVSVNLTALLGENGSRVIISPDILNISLDDDGGKLLSPPVVEVKLQLTSKEGVKTTVERTVKTENDIHILELAEFPVGTTVVLDSVKFVYPTMETFTNNRYALLNFLLFVEQIVDGDGIGNGTGTAVAPTIDYEKAIADLTRRTEQSDFVEIVERYSKTQKMMFKRINAGKFEVILYGNGRNTTFEFYKNTDDMIVQTRVTSGTCVENRAVINGYSHTLFTGGTFTGLSSDPVVAYVSTVGTVLSMTAKVAHDGSSIRASIPKMNEGGLWSVTLNDKDAVEVSCYSATAVTDDVVLFKNVPKGTHTVKFTFKGLVPSTTVATPKGLVTKNPNKAVMVEGITLTTGKATIFTESSNKEFALYYRPKEGTKFNFLPYHGVSTAFNAEPSKFLDDLTEIPYETMANNETTTLTSFGLRQHIYGQHEEAARNLVEVWCNHVITPKGKLSIDGRYKVLEDITMNNSYVIMGTVRGDMFDRLVSSFGNQFKADETNYGVSIPLKEERDWAASYAFLSDKNPDLVVACRTNNIKETLRQGQFGKDTDPAQMAYLQNRDATIKKIYNRLFNSSIVPAGYSQKFSGDYVFETIPGINNLF